MAHILRIDEMAKTHQLRIKDYMNANHPNVDMLNDTLTPFMYGDEWFYPLASRPARRDFNRVDKRIEYNKWCERFSKSIGYDWDVFYDIAKGFGYGTCDVFACRVNGELHYLIPTTNMFAEFPFRMFSSGDFDDMESRLNEIFDNAENNF